MFDYITTTNRFVWDIYAEIAAKQYAKTSSSPGTAARYAAEFADAMCVERSKRFPKQEPTSITSTKKGQ